ncbi:hypothetical protein AHAS_Ahas01G0098000 [Arachis hypogaea]
MAARSRRPSTTSRSPSSAVSSPSLSFAAPSASTSPPPTLMPSTRASSKKPTTFSLRSAPTPTSTTTTPLSVPTPPPPSPLAPRSLIGINNANNGSSKILNTLIS